jgi:hypothetical protein
MAPTIHRHELWINNTMIASWVRPPNRPLVFSANYAYMIDSGAFCGPGDDTITVTLKVWETGDVSPQVGSYTVPVKNRALTVNRYEWEMSQRNFNEANNNWSTGFTGSHYLDMMPSLMPLINRSNQSLYNRSFVNGQPRYWNGEDFFNAMTGKNFLLLGTHGIGEYYSGYGFSLAPETDRFDVDHLFPIPPAQFPKRRELLSWQFPLFPQLRQDFVANNGSHIGTFHRIKSYTSVAQGSGLTPFNSTGEPPLQILFSMACFLGGDFIPNGPTNLASEFLYPYKNTYSTTFPENQAAVFAAGGVTINKAREYMTTFVTLLDETLTVNQAVARIRANVSLLPEGDFVVVGDADATAKGVYTGNTLLGHRDSARSLQ